MSATNAAFFAAGFVLGIAFCAVASWLIAHAPQVPDQEEPWRLIP